MDKNILREYESMLLEKSDTENRIKDLEQQLQIYDKNYRVQDSVTGGMGGIEHYTIKGFPYPEYSKKKSILLSRKIRLEELKKRLEESIDEVEEFIDSIESSTMRLILKYRYIDGLAWKEIAGRMGKGYSEESIRKKCNRFISKE